MAIKLSLNLTVSCIVGNKEVVYCKVVTLPIVPRQGYYVYINDHATAECMVVVLREDYYPMIQLAFVDSEENEMQPLPEDEFLTFQEELLEDGWEIAEDEDEQETVKPAPSPSKPHYH